MTALPRTMRPCHRTLAGPHNVPREVPANPEYEASIKAILDATGTRPTGFNAFWMRGTPKTLEILQDLGFTYHIESGPGHSLGPLSSNA